MNLLRKRIENSYEKVLTNNIVGSLVDDMERAEILNFAYSMAYVTLLSMVPSLAAIFGLIDLFAPLIGSNSNFVVEGKAFLFRHLAPASGEIVTSTLAQVLDNISFANIGITGFTSLIITLVLLLANIEKAFNKIFNVTTARNMVTRFIYFWTFITLGTVGFITGFGYVFRRFFEGAEASGGNDILSFVVTRLTALLFVFLLYKVVPNRFVSAKSAAVGATITTVLFFIALSFIKLYSIYFTSLKMIYGALVALPLLLIWLHIVWVIVLFGAIVCHRMEIGFKVNRANTLEPDSAKDKYIALGIKLELPLKLLDYIYNEEKIRQVPLTISL